MSEGSIFEDQTLETIEALQCQEQRYACHDFCRMHRDVATSPTLRADRKLMLKWMHNVIDYFNLNRETASIAMTYSDRFMQTDQGPEFLRDTNKYQLLCIASLYLAVKVHETASLTPKVFVEIGHGQYGVGQIEDMERVLLKALEWRVNPPTALGFVRLFLDLISDADMDCGMKASAYMLARAQTERAVGDYGLLTVEPSKIAFASVQNSIESLGYCCNGGSVLSSMAAFFASDFMDQDLTELRLRLCEAISYETSLMSLVPSRSSKNKTPTKAKANNGSPQEGSTPRSVLCHPQ